MIDVMHEPREYSADELAFISFADCPSTGDPGFGFLPYKCSLDAGHPGPHRAGVEPGVYVASWDEETQT